MVNSLTNILNKKILVVSAFMYQPFLFNYKNAHPELDIKFMHLSELKDLLSFTYKKDPIPYLIKKGIEYSKARKYALLLKSSDYSANPTLASLYLELIGEYIPDEVNELGLYELNNLDIYLFEDDEDNEVISLLNKHHLSFKLLHFEDLDIKETAFYLNPTIKVYKNKFSQYFNIFSDIRDKLINQKYNPNNISILVENDYDLYYIKYFASLFKIETFIRLKSPIKNNLIIKNKLKEIYNTKSLDFSKDDSNESKILENLINKYELKDLDFDYAYINLVEIIEKENLVTTLSNKGINVYSDINFNLNEYIYVTCFKDGIFYKVAKDNNVLNDEELEKIHANPSYNLTLLDKRNKQNYLKYLNIAHLSRIETHLQDKIYDSSFIKENHWEDKIKVVDFVNEGMLTEEAHLIYKSHIYDINFYKEKEDLVNSYDHQFKAFKTNRPIFNIDKYSVSSIKEYVSCPFKFYLNKILPDTNEEAHQLWKGILIHKLLENIYKDDYDFEIEFTKAKASYYFALEKSNYQASKKEEVYIEIIKHWIKYIVIALRKEKDKYVYPFNYDAEIKINYRVANSNFIGSIDKLLFVDNNEKFYTIVDYKTGNHNNDLFDLRLVPTGYDIQLPLYYYALFTKGAKVDLADFRFGGMGIRHVYGSSVKDAFFDGDYTSEEIINKKLAIDGMFLANANYFKAFDENNINDKGNITKSTKILTSGQLFDEEGNTTIKYNGITLPYSLDKMVEDVIEIVEQNIDNILSNNFEIAPISIDLLGFDNTKLVCAYCPYKDICYHSRHDAMDLFTKTFFQKFMHMKEEKIDG